MRVNTHGKPIPPEPRWMRVAEAFGGQVGNQMRDAIMAPANAMNGKYNERTIDANGHVSPFDPRMMDDASNLAGMVTLGSGAVPIEPNSFGMGLRVYHGSPHDFERPDITKVGAGEGTQIEGHGLYVAQEPKVAEYYKSMPPDLYKVYIDGEPIPIQGLTEPYGYIRNTLQTYQGKNVAIAHLGARLNDLKRRLAFQEENDQTRGSFLAKYKELQQKADNVAQAIRILANAKSVEAQRVVNPKSKLYELDLNADPEKNVLDLNASFADQSPEVKKKLLTALTGNSDDPLGDFFNGYDGYSLYQLLKERYEGDAKEASMKLKSVGIRAMQYLDSGSETGKAYPPTRNFVVLDDKYLTILKKYGLIGATATGVTAGAMGTHEDKNTIGT